MVSLRRLCLYTTLACFAIAGFAQPTVTVASSIFTFSLIVLSAQIVASFICDQERRSYHIGFSAICALYLWVAMVSRNNGNENLLLTQRLFYEIEGLFPLHEYVTPLLTYMPYHMPSQNLFRTEQLFAIWHSIWSVFLGEVAGVISYELNRHRIKSV